MAATRARRTLWLSAAPATDESGAVRADRRSPLGIIWPQLEARFERAAAPQEPPPPRALLLKRLQGLWEPAPLPAPVVIVELPAPYLASDAVEFSWVGETQRHIGTLVHAYLARLAATERAASADAPLSVATLEGQLARLGVPEAERYEAALRVREAVTQTLEDARGRWILEARRGAHAELALSGVVEGSLRSVIIDRSFIDADGVRWVIDYKTSRHEGGGREAFLDEELTRYRGQLTTYRALARALGPEPVRAGLYFPLLKAFREVS